jgi:hypothetical protein
LSSRLWRSFKKTRIFGMFETLTMGISWERPD